MNRVPESKKNMSESKQETKQETKEETKTEAELNSEAYDNIINYLMTHPETGERMSYEESRMMYG